MIVKIGESRQHILRSGTYDSINVDILAVASQPNKRIVESDVNKAMINIKVILKRNNIPHILMQDNLLLLGTYSTLKKGLERFKNGLEKIKESVTDKHTLLFPCRISFGGHHRVGSGDELIVEVTPAQVGVFSSNIDLVQSYIEFEANPSIGYETGIYQTVSEVVQANTNKQSFSPGDNIVRLSYLNFDKQDLKQEVINNITISSDRFDDNLTFNQLLSQEVAAYDEMPRDIQQPENKPGLYPQSFTLFDGLKIANEMDNCKVDISFNSSYVNSSANYLVYTKYFVDQSIIMDSAIRMAKHTDEKQEKIANASNPSSGTKK